MIFDSAPGVVGTVITGQALPFMVSIGGTGGVAPFPMAGLIKAVLTGFKFGGRSGLGVRHTLRDRIYVYVFGERAAPVEVSGVGFAGVCNSTVAGSTGFDGLHAYYERVRASSSGVPVRLVLGPRTTLRGFMHGFDFNLEDPQSGLGSFQFQFVAMPRVLTFGVTQPLPWE